MNFVFDLLTGALVACAAMVIASLLVVGVAYVSSGYDKVASHFPRTASAVASGFWILVILVVLYAVGSDVRAAL